jgi:hypothetical protein
MQSLASRMQAILDYTGLSKDADISLIKEKLQEKESEAILRDEATDHFTEKEQTLYEYEKYLKTETVEDQETEDQETEDQETEDQETEDQETEDQETEDQETEDQETEDQETEDQETEDQETEDQETGQKDQETGQADQETEQADQETGQKDQETGQADQETEQKDQETGQADQETGKEAVVDQQKTDPEVLELDSDEESEWDSVSPSGFARAKSTECCVSICPFNDNGKIAALVAKIGTSEDCIAYAHAAGKLDPTCAVYHDDTGIMITSVYAGGTDVADRILYQRDGVDVSIHATVLHRIGDCERVFDMMTGSLFGRYARRQESVRLTINANDADDVAYLERLCKKSMDKWALATGELQSRLFADVKVCLVDRLKGYRLLRANSTDIAFVKQTSEAERALVSTHTHVYVMTVNGAAVGVLAASRKAEKTTVTYARHSSPEVLDHMLVQLVQDVMQRFEEHTFVSECAVVRELFAPFQPLEWRGEKSCVEGCLKLSMGFEMRAKLKWPDLPYLPSAGDILGYKVGNTYLPCRVIYSEQTWHHRANVKQVMKDVDYNDDIPLILCSSEDQLIFVADAMKDELIDIFVSNTIHLKMEAAWKSSAYSHLAQKDPPPPLGTVGWSKHGGEFVLAHVVYAGVWREDVDAERVIGILNANADLGPFDHRVLFITLSESDQIAVYETADADWKGGGGAKERAAMNGAWQKSKYRLLKAKEPVSEPVPKEPKERKRPATENKEPKTKKAKKAKADFSPVQERFLELVYATIVDDYEARGRSSGIPYYKEFEKVFIEYKDRFDSGFADFYLKLDYTEFGQSTKSKLRSLNNVVLEQNLATLVKAAFSP